MTTQEPSTKIDVRLGTELCGKWTLERRLGEGGMAAVYVALHRIGRRDAIKILHPHVANDAELRARFEQEAQAVNRFHHPGAVEIRDIDVSEDGAPFLVMELLEGQSLGERAQQGPLGGTELLGYLDQLLDVLAAAHANDIVHRDIKPDNLFVQPDGRLKVLDFGIARVRDSSAGRKLATRVGMAIGTVSYMPPEQLSGVGVDHRADLFATGATWLRLLTGRRVHETRNQSELMVKMATLPAPPVLSVCPEVDPNVAAVIDRALAYDKEQRYPDAVTMQADVRSLLRGERPLHTGPPASAASAASSTSLPRPTLAERPYAAPVQGVNEATNTFRPVSQHVTVQGAPQGANEPTHAFGPAPLPATVQGVPQGANEPTHAFGPASLPATVQGVPQGANEPTPTYGPAAVREPASATTTGTLPLPLPASVTREAALAAAAATMLAEPSPAPSPAVADGTNAATRSSPLGSPPAALAPTVVAAPSPVAAPFGSSFVAPSSSPGAAREEKKTSPALLLALVAGGVAALCLLIVFVALGFYVFGAPGRTAGTDPTSVDTSGPLGGRPPIATSTPATGTPGTTTPLTTTPPGRNDPGPPEGPPGRDKKKKPK